MALKKHGECATLLYSRWDNMKQRVLNPNSPVYKHYGGRGIKICSSWLDYRNFRDWAIYHGWDVKLTLDRENNNGNYTPENCRWVSGTENRKNVATRKRNKKYNWGVTKPDKKYIVTVWLNKKNNYLGSFVSEDEAIKVRNEFIKYSS